MIYKELFNKLKNKQFNSLEELKEDIDFKELEKLEKSPEFKKFDDQILLFRKDPLEKRNYNLLLKRNEDTQQIEFQINERINKLFYVYYKPSIWFRIKQCLIDNTNILKPCVLTCKNSKYRVIDMIEVKSTI